MNPFTGAPDTAQATVRVFHTDQTPSITRRFATTAEATAYIKTMAPVSTVREMRTVAGWEADGFHELRATIRNGVCTPRHSVQCARQIEAAA